MNGIAPGLEHPAIPGYSRISIGRSFVALALIAICGCAGGPRRARVPVFPIGLYTAHDASELTPIGTAGFDHVLAYGKPGVLAAIAAEAKRLGLSIIVDSPYGLMRDSSTNVASWPVAAWHIQDEPDVNRVSPDKLRQMSAQVRAWDPGRPQIFVVGQGSAARDYGAIGDALMLDWYPVPHLPLDSVADQIDVARSFLPAGKPLWFVVQAFDWRDDPPRIPGRLIGRFPTYGEIRFMSWIAVLHGADGLIYFRLHRPNGKTLFNYPEMWQNVERVSLEMRAMKPVIAHGTPQPPPVAGLALESRAWRRRGRRYVVIANRRNSQTPFPSEFLSKAWRPLFESTHDTRELLSCGGAACSLRPYQVMVFERRLWWF